MSVNTTSSEQQPGAPATAAGWSGPYDVIIIGAGISGKYQLKDRTDFQRLCSLPGVAAILAMVILAEGGDLRRFPHHRQFLKYCGLDLAKRPPPSAHMNRREFKSISF